MAKRFIISDDLTGEENGSVKGREIRFPEGTLTIDLSDDNYGALMDAVAPYVSAGEWTPRETGNDENTVIREWARENGFDVSSRGRLSSEVVNAYREYLKSREASAQPAVEPTDNAESDTDNAESTDTDNGRQELAASDA